MGELPHSWSTRADIPADPGAGEWSDRRLAGSRTKWSAASRRWLTAVVAVAALLPAAVLHDGRTTAAPSTHDRFTLATRTLRSLDPAAGERPAPRRAESSRPLGVPLPPPAAPGAFGFIGHQPSSDAPIAYDPCRPIPYVVNERTAPPGTQLLVSGAVAEIARVTGLRFEYEGTTDEVVAADRDMFQPERYGDRWAPVLIAWSDESEFPELAGDIAGVGGSGSVLPGTGEPAVYVSGLVALDGPQLRAMYASVHGRIAARGLVLHELAHLVGLDHVDDPGQLMFERAETTSLQSGDLAGLARLGAGECVAEL